MDKRRTTPYSLAATEFFDMVYSGGKKDDITAVVVSVG
jgi:protein phosphatase PTC7